MKNYLQFMADFPEDASWDNRGNLLVPGGLGVCLFLVSGLRGLAVDCSDPKQHSFYGWSFTARAGVGGAWVLLQGGLPWLLICEPRRRLLSGVFGQTTELGCEKLLQTVDEIVRSDSRITEKAWYNEAEYRRKPRGPGSASPL